MFTQILQDALFSAIAAIGFAAISRPPSTAYPLCALIAAAGHSLRFILMSDAVAGMHIIPATLAASLLIGTLAVLVTPMFRIPAETCLFPSLLPMIPGIYAYKAFAGLALCLFSGNQETFSHSFFPVRLQRDDLLMHTAVHGNRRGNTAVRAEKDSFSGHTIGQ